ncbi:MAG: uracil-DNA glycosylase family protein [Bdellovibrionales bacterium]
MPNREYIAAKAALEFYADHGVDIAINDDAVDKTALSYAPPAANVQKPDESLPQKSNAGVAKLSAQSQPLLGKTDAQLQAVKFAKAANTLDELKQAIQEFEGIGLKKTATNLVFADGNPEADIMLIGDAPGADEDRIGKPFVGVAGELLDKILACIKIDRTAEDLKQSVYLTNILNWRPPGNRTPTNAEIEISLPFIERHIQLAKPKLIIMCGGVSAKSLTATGQSISRLRKTWHDYKPSTLSEGTSDQSIPAIATYHPDYLLSTPSQKRAVWQDILSVQDKRKELGLLP